MRPSTHKARLVRQAYWLIKLRWIAIVGVCLAVFFASKILNVTIQSMALYCIVLVLVCYNSLFLILLNIAVKRDRSSLACFVNKLVNTQISADLVVLTILLHFSGGVENPCIIYFIFHMVIASILLSAKESYLQATLAVALIVLLALLEYKNLIPHYCLSGFVARDLHGDGLHIAGGVFVFATTLYMIVYMTSSIANQLRQQEEAFRQANIQLEEKDRIKDEYVSRVTHDIKGHLGAIQSCLDVVETEVIGPLNDKQKEFVHRVHSRTTKLSDFVRALLKLTRMRLSNKFEKEVFSLSDTLKGAVASVNMKASDKSIKLVYSLEGFTAEIYGNQLSIEEMITNLLLNAIKYTPRNGSVEIMAIDLGEQFLIEIADTGIGIPQEDLPYIFDEFFRASNAKKTERDGTGLGLSIAKQIINRHFGKIWAESKIGEGTKFSFTIPKSGFEDR
ncbi:MAG: HAMP domain-containing histidine kinase [Sedimentisphaerales bacterium]|nr:HAMP domain-containing histidine kinase [Sedimentisphaerales bacterium]